MNQIEKAAAIEAMIDTAGWDVLYEYLVKGSTPSLVPVDGLDSLIKQAYKNGVCQGYADVLRFVIVTVENAKRKRNAETPDIFFTFDLKKNTNHKIS